MHSRLRVLFPFFLFAFCLYPEARAQTASERLEKAIYTEETVGDVRAAATLYEGIVADADLPTRQRAEAQYRLALAQLKQGEKMAAIHSFKKLKADFPQASDLVERAERFLDDSPFGNVPWEDGERLEYSVKLPGGMEIGALILTARSETLEGEEVWRFDVRRLFSEMERGLGRVYVRQSDFSPIRSTVKSTAHGNYKVSYDESGVDFEIVNGAEVDKTRTAIEGPVYDNEQVLYLLRGLDLSEAYKGKFNFLPLGSVVELGVEVVDLKTVKVPAGKFEAFQLKLSIHQKVWISNDEQRYPVKLNFGGVIAELKNVDRVRDVEKLTFF